MVRRSSREKLTSLSDPDQDKVDKGRTHEKDLSYVLKLDQSMFGDSFTDSKLNSFGLYNRLLIARLTFIDTILVASCS